MDFDSALTNSEDTLLFFAVSPQYTNMKNLMKEINTYIQNKRENDQTDRFNIIAFEELGPVYFEDFVYDEQYILDALQEIKWAKPNTDGGIYLAVTFIIDVFKQVSAKTFRLIVLMDKSAPEIQNPEVCLSLINQVIDMPFFIEFVRINCNDPKADLQLIKFSKKCNGEVLYAENDSTGLRKVLQQLTNKKKIQRSILIKTRPDASIVNPTNELFYQNLAQDLQYLDDERMERSICHICREKGELVECPSCKTESHAACLAMWAQNSNIGAPHIFRCDQCFNLLKLPKEFVLDVQNGRFNEILKRQIAFKPMNQHDFLKQKEAKAKPSLKTGQDPFGFAVESADSLVNNSDDVWVDNAKDFKW